MKLARIAGTALGVALALAACAKDEGKPPSPGPPVETMERTDPSAVPPETIVRAVATPVAESGLSATDLAALRAEYPLTTCPICGMELGGKGDPAEVLVQGRLVRLCSAGCIAQVEADPAAAFGRIDAAVEAARGS